MVEIDSAHFEKAGVYVLIRDQRRIMETEKRIQLPGIGTENHLRHGYILAPFSFKIGESEFMPYTSYEPINKICEGGVDTSTIGAAAYNLMDLSCADGAFLLSGREIVATKGIIDARFEDLKKEHEMEYEPVLLHYLRDAGEPPMQMQIHPLRADGMIVEKTIPSSPGTRTGSALSIALRYGGPIQMASQTGGGRLLVMGKKGLEKRYRWDVVEGLGADFYVDAQSHLALVCEKFSYDEGRDGAYNTGERFAVNINQVSRDGDFTFPMQARSR